MKKSACEWQITFRNGDSVWQHYVYGSRADAEDAAARSCYEPTTQYVVRLAPPLDERTVIA